MRVFNFSRFLLCALMILMLCASCSQQRFRSKHSRNFYSNNYKGRLVSAKKQCDNFYKRKKKKRSRPIFAWSKKSNAGGSSSIAMAEVDPNDKPPPPKPKPKPQPKPEPTPDPKPKNDFEQLSIEEKHDIEDEVLKKNNIPPPTSEEHERIRKEVADQIANKSFPQDLEPLYFVHDEDEFSVVDMEPFLIAVEYALQGRTILIEGHTDATGGDNYNVQLSIQRVEKIRSLMHDMGVPDERISVIGYGEEVAVHDNTTEEGRQKNRRVDFKVF